MDELTKREYIQVDDVVDIVGLSNRWAKRMLDVLEERGKIIRKKEGYTLKPDSSAGK